MSKYEGLSRGRALDLGPSLGSLKVVSPGLAASLVISTPQGPCSERPERRSQGPVQGRLWLSTNNPHLVHHVFPAWASSRRSQVTPGSRRGCRGRVSVYVCVCSSLGNPDIWRMN